MTLGETFIYKERSSSPQHVRHNEKPDMRPANVDLIEMGDASVARSDGYVLKLYVHVVFGCAFPPQRVSFSSMIVAGEDMVLGALHGEIGVGADLRGACRDILGQN